MSCLLVIDIQNDFCDKKGSLYVKESDEIIDNINKFIIEKRKSLEVIYTKDNHIEINSHFIQEGGIWPIHCMEGTWGNMFYSKLFVGNDDKIVKKGMYGDGYSAFSEICLKTKNKIESELANYLTGKNISDIIIIGIAFDYCVLSTALDASERGFNVSIIKSLTKSVDPSKDEFNINLLEKNGVKILEQKIIE